VIRTAVPRAAVFLLAVAILPWVVTSTAGALRSPSSAVGSGSDAIGSLTLELVVTPDRPKVWPGRERTNAARGLHAMPAAPAGIDQPRSRGDDIRPPASAGSTDVLANDLAERAPPPQAV
jgi:hypothetical protein